jgi:hypothetical protein
MARRIEFAGGQKQANLRYLQASYLGCCDSHESIERVGCGPLPYTRVRWRAAVAARSREPAAFRSGQRITRQGCCSRGASLWLAIVNPSSMGSEHHVGGHPLCVNGSALALLSQIVPHTVAPGVYASGWGVTSLDGGVLMLSAADGDAG